MTSRLHTIIKDGAQCPDFVASNLQYETISGSVSYGISNDMSDQDCIGFCIPLKSHIFPNFHGEIEGFNRLPRFDQFIKHGYQIEDTKYDVTVYNIVKFFRLAAEGNINVLESLFTPIDCVTYQTPIGSIVRDNKRLFLSKRIKHSVIGYAYSQRGHIKGKGVPTGKRKELFEKYGWDTKHLAHTVRLLNYGEQILGTGDLDLRQPSDFLKACRRGEVTPEAVDKLFGEKEQTLEKLFRETKLPASPDMDAVKQLLLDCIEHHYGSFKEIDRTNKFKDALNKIAAIVNQF